MANRKKRTPEKEAEFLAALTEGGGNVSEACRQVRIGLRTVYEWRQGDKAFTESWDRAVERGSNFLEDEAIRRAMQGVEEPVFYQGKKVSTIRRYSDTLLIFMLKARRPEKFKDRSEVQHKGLEGLAERLKEGRERASRRVATEPRHEAGDDPDDD